MNKRVLQVFQNPSFQRGLRNGLPICLGYISVSFTYGLHATESGVPFWAALLVSMTNLTSAGQFAGTDLFVAGANYLEVALTTFVINIRYSLMSLSLSQKADPSMTTGQRLLLSFGITDEVFAVSAQEKGTVTAPYLAGLILMPFLGWELGTILGGSASALLPFAIRSALGIAIYGMFLAIIIPPAAKVRPIAITVLVAAALSCLFRFTPVLRNISSGWIIILCTILAASFAALRFPIADEEATE